MYFLDNINRKERQKQRAERCRCCSTHPAFRSSWETELKTTLVVLRQSQAEDSLTTGNLFFFLLCFFRLFCCCFFYLQSSRSDLAEPVWGGLTPPRGRRDIPVYSLGTYRRRSNPQRPNWAARSQVDFACRSDFPSAFFFPRIH